MDKQHFVEYSSIADELSKNLQGQGMKSKRWNSFLAPAEPTGWGYNGGVGNTPGLLPAAAFSLSVSSVREEEDGQWKEEQKLEAHSDWVRDVAWAPSIGLPTSTIASCSQVSSDP